MTLRFSIFAVAFIPFWSILCFDWTRTTEAQGTPLPPEWLFFVGWGPLAVLIAWLALRLVVAITRFPICLAANTILSTPAGLQAERRWEMLLGLLFSQSPSQGCSGDQVACSLLARYTLLKHSDLPSFLREESSHRMDGLGQCFFGHFCRELGFFHALLIAAARPYFAIVEVSRHEQLAILSRLPKGHRLLRARGKV